MIIARSPRRAPWQRRSLARLDPRKFRDPFVTADGEKRAQVALKSLDTLWFNTGTLCNLTCQHCYIELSPKNDRLVYLSAAEVAEYLDEIETGGSPTSLIGFTGGEPFMNPELPAMLEDVAVPRLSGPGADQCDEADGQMKPALLRLRERFGDRLTIRVSIDHYGRAVHEAERGRRSWQPTIDGLLWLARNGFSLHVASRRLSGEPEAAIRAGFAGSVRRARRGDRRRRPGRADRVSRKWTPRPTCRRSPRRAGASSANRRKA